MTEAGERARQTPSIVQAQAVVDALIAAGVRRVAYCPGSRNAPFAYVLSAYEDAGLISVSPFAQESTGAFWALGAAKALGGREPVAVFTTSGTAVSQMHAALEEARHQGIPLVAVTADRPFELVDVGASQTTRQHGIFGPTTMDSLDIPADAPSGVAQRVGRVVRRALGWGGRRGPVHINVGFRDPLVPEQPIYVGGRSAHAESDVARVRASDQPLGAVAWNEVVDPSLNTVVIAGESEPFYADTNLKIGEYAANLGIPVLAEPSSGLTQVSTWIPHSQLLAPVLAGQVQQVLVLGKPTLSRPIARIFGGEGVAKIVVSAHHEWPDTAGNAGEVVADLETKGGHTHDAAWLEQWQSASARVGEGARKEWGSRPLNHLMVAEAIWASQPQVALWLGASNAVRAFDIAAEMPGRRLVFSNRGLAGIDGTIASALGAQSVLQRPVRVVMGDLTFVYDMAALGASGAPTPDIQLIVLDDAGGRIFESLEHGSKASAETLERYFAVPQNVDVCAVGKACGWDVRCISDEAELREALELPVTGRSILHLCLDSPAELFDSVRVGAISGWKLRRS